MIDRTMAGGDPGEAELRVADEDVEIRLVLPAGRLRIATGDVDEYDIAHGLAERLPPRAAFGDEAAVGGRPPWLGAGP